MRGMNPPYLHACVSHIFCGIVGSNLASTSEKVVLGSTYERKEGGGYPPKQGDHDTDRLFYCNQLKEYGNMIGRKVVQ